MLITKVHKPHQSTNKNVNVMIIACKQHLYKTNYLQNKDPSAKEMYGFNALSILVRQMMAKKTYKINSRKEKHVDKR